MRSNACAWLLVAMACLGCGGASTTSAQPPRATPLSRADAEKIALARFPDASVQSAELEDENGYRVWSFDLARPGTADVTEVQVDARNGKIVHVATETPAEQQKEDRSR